MHATSSLPCYVNILLDDFLAAIDSPCYRKSTAGCAAVSAALDDTHTTRTDPRAVVQLTSLAIFSSVGRRRSVRRKWPKLLTPSFG
jgi:hypothetical protein